MHLSVCVSLCKCEYLQLNSAGLKITRVFVISLGHRIVKKNDVHSDVNFSMWIYRSPTIISLNWVTAIGRFHTTIFFFFFFGFPLFSVRVFIFFRWYSKSLCFFFLLLFQPIYLFTIDWPRFVYVARSVFGLMFFSMGYSRWQLVRALFSLVLIHLVHSHNLKTIFLNSNDLNFSMKMNATMITATRWVPNRSFGCKLFIAFYFGIENEWCCLHVHVVDENPFSNKTRQKKTECLCICMCL